MNGKTKKRISKVLPVGIAMGILFSSAPVTEYKVKADVDTAATFITTFGEIYDRFLAEPFGKWLEEVDVKTTYTSRNENIAYKAPTFKKGEFGISAFDYYKNQDFSKKVKIAYANGKVEYKTIKHGEQILIKKAGTIVDLTPDEPSLSKHDILYITQKQLDEGSTGVSLTNFKTYYLESDNSGRRNDLGWAFLKKQFPNAYHNGIRVPGVNEDELFKKLPEDKRILGTSTSNPVDKEALSKYVTNDSEALADFKKRELDLFAETKLILDTPIQSPYGYLNGGNSWNIIPYKKGTNKVLLKTNSKYVSGKEGNGLQYSDSIGDDELFELVQIQPDPHSNKFQFHILNKNGVPLGRTLYLESFTNPHSGSDDISFSLKSNNEINNWLREWYPGKENEKQKYEGIEIEWDKEVVNRPKLAKDSSGNVIKNSWVDINGIHRYAGSDGIFLTAWQEIEGKTYYFNLNAELVTTSGTEIEGKYYHFNDDGSVKRSTWTNLYYSDASGVVIKEGLREIDGKIYYFKDYSANTNEIRLEDQNVTLHFSDKGVLERATGLNGEALNSSHWVTFDDKQLVFEKGGSIRKNGVSKISLPGLNLDRKEQPALVYYSLEEGPSYSGWKEVDGKKYYFDGGRSYTFDGHQEIGGKKYYFTQDGEAKLTGFDKKDGKIYYYDDKGVMQKGWQQIDNKWYYFQDSGEATIGKFKDWGFYHGAYQQFTYHLSKDGSMYQNTYVYLRLENGKYQEAYIDEHGHHKPIGNVLDWPQKDLEITD